MSVLIPTRDELTRIPATRWHSWNHKPYLSVYLNAVTGEGTTSTGTPFTSPPGLALRELVEALPSDSQQVYLCGQLPEASQVGSLESELYSPFNSWVVEAHPQPVYLDSGTTHDATYARVWRSDGRFVDIRTAACWVGTNDCTPQEAYDALQMVTIQLQRRKPKWETMCLLATPAATGRELWRSAIGLNRNRQSSAYPILPQDIRNLIHMTSGQGRFEMLPASTPDGMAPSIIYLDGRFMYAAPCLEELGIGPVLHDILPDYAGFTPARYRVGFRVPEGWAHVGLLMVPTPDGEHWHFPRTPGKTGETWGDASELRIALAPFPHFCPDCATCYRVNDGSACPLHGWTIAIQERLIFTRGRPLRTWAEHLVVAREECNTNALAGAALRRILLNTIGAFHGTRRPVTQVALAAGVPDHTSTRLVRGSEGDDLYLWEEPGLAARSPDYDRPEWSSQVWARTRSRLLLHRDHAGNFTGALTLPFESIVAFRLDALYTTVDPHWPDTGSPGVLRAKGHLSGPVPWPKEEIDLAAVKERLP